MAIINLTDALNERFDSSIIVVDGVPVQQKDVIRDDAATNLGSSLLAVNEGDSGVDNNHTNPKYADGTHTG